MAANNKNLPKKTLEELLRFQEATKIVYNYYDNLAQANHGLYDGTNDLEEKYIVERATYHKLLEEIFNEIKKRVDEIL